MIPVVSVDEMRGVDADAPEPVEVLVERAASAVARAALRLMGGAYGRRVVVVAGPGHNGDDGRVAARRLAARGARLTVLDAKEAEGAVLPACDLAIDAAYGTGFRGEYRAPLTPSPVLAVDLPSGVAGDTGEAVTTAVRAVATVTFAALKPGLLLGEGPARSGTVEVVDIGLDVSRARAALVEDDDLRAWVPARPRDSHKWRTAVGVVAGSPGMLGAAELCSRGAMRAGAGMIRLGVPGADDGSLPANEVVGRGLPATDWWDAALEWTGRTRALVVGPGLGRQDATVAAVRHLVARAPVPLVLDADGLYALGGAPEEVLRSRTAPTVITPHDGEFARLTGDAPGPDRLSAARRLAERTGAVVLLKGSTTVVAEPGGRVLLSASGGPRLATAGTGDVLSGVIAALLAQGVAPPEAAAAGAHLHGRAARLGPDRGLVAGDVADLLPAAWRTVTDAGTAGGAGTGAGGTGG
ncbi:MAG TPA: NAD(P)H-hydrate dehydratase [Acidimicrobiales bacterium]|nr:NAD(P)H-hydrate dehydratase [Acidimicrobiales bacterium]